MDSLIHSIHIMVLRSYGILVPGTISRKLVVVLEHTVGLVSEQALGVALEQDLAQVLVRDLVQVPGLDSGQALQHVQEEEGVSVLVEVVLVDEVEVVLVDVVVGELVLVDDSCFQRIC